MSGLGRRRIGGAALRGGGPESPVGRRHHVHPDAGGLPVSGYRSRRLQPSGRGLGDGGASSYHAGGRGAGDGGGAPAAGGGDPPLRPGLPVHVAGLRGSLPGAGGRSRRRLARGSKPATRATTRIASQFLLLHGGRCLTIPATRCVAISTTRRVRPATSLSARVSLRLCSPPSRRVAALRPRFAGLTALTAAPRTRPAFLADWAHDDLNVGPRVALTSKNVGYDLSEADG